MRTPDPTGQFFGRLLVLSPIKYFTFINGNGRKDYARKVDVLCTCGTKKEVNWKDLRRGSVVSCGCYLKEIAKKVNTTHGLRRSKEYGIWNTMINRCHNPNSTEYYSYGAIGIYVCDRWRFSFTNFISDMGVRPTNSHSIDRIKNEAGYSPENCKWATKTEQANNKKNTLYITFGGETKPLKYWCRELGLPYPQVHFRLNRLKWSPEKALTTPFKKQRLVNEKGLVDSVSENSAKTA